MREEEHPRVDNPIDRLLEAASFLDGIERHNLHGYARRSSPLASTDTDSNNEPDTRERRRNGGREMHNQLEKYRRAQLKDHFLALKKVVPSLTSKKHSNQSILKQSQKYIQTLIAKERKYQMEIQDLARRKVELDELLRRKTEEVEQVYGRSVKSLLEIENGEDIGDECSSISTKSADEVANLKDFDEEADNPVPSPPLPPPPPQPVTRGIPHPVIRETPMVSQRQPSVSSATATQPQSLPPPAAPPINQTIPQTTVKKLHAKLTSTKQAVAGQGGGTHVMKITDSGAQVHIQRQSTPPIAPAGSAKIPIPSQFRPAAIAQSLLTQTAPPQQRTQQPTTFATTARPAAAGTGFMVPVAATHPTGGTVAVTAGGVARLRLPSNTFSLAGQAAVVNGAGQLVTPVNLPLGAAGQMQTPAMITVQSSSTGQYLVRVPALNGHQSMMYFNSVLQGAAAAAAVVTTAAAATTTVIATTTARNPATSIITTKSNNSAITNNS